MAMTNVLIAVALCTLGHSETFSFRKVAEGLTNRQLRRSDDLVLPTVSPGLNPGDAGVAEWPSEFKPDIMSAFELLKSKRAAAPEEGEGQGQPGPTFPFAGGFGNFPNPLTSMGSGLPNISNVSELGQQFYPNGNNSGNLLETYNPMTQMGNYTSGLPMSQMSNFTSGLPMSQMSNFTSGLPMSQMSNFTSGLPMSQMSNFTSGLPMSQMGNLTSGNPMSQLNGMTNLTNPYTGSIPFMNNNNKPEGDKESK